MLSDLLSSVADEVGTLVSEEGYLLARVVVDGRSMLAEVTREEAATWPRVEGVLQPESEVDHRGDEGGRIRLFDPPGGAELLLERVASRGPLQEEEALSLGMMLLATLRRLHAEGRRLGYIGPESVLMTESGAPLLLAGARGVPATPFSAPEMLEGTTHDPRSDVFALGILVFRAIAGSDDRQRQIDAWNELSPPLLALLEKMVSPEPDERLPNLTALSSAMGRLRSLPPGEEDGRWRESEPTTPGRTGGRWSRWVWVLLSAVSAALVLMLVLGIPGGEGEPAEGPPDGVAAEPVPTGPDSLPEEDVEAPVDTQTVVEPYIWISNGTGAAGAASDFRVGPASGFSRVYTCTASPRSSSVALVRRDDPRSPLEGQERLTNALTELLAEDTTIAVRPVDLSILLGADLTDDVLREGVLLEPVSPAGTLYVDVANHGLTGRYGGTGAATWTRSVLDGSSLSLEGEEWLVRVVDFRDGDTENPELGIPAELDSTVFLAREDPLLVSAEEQLRSALMDTIAPPTGDYPVPDVWILLGS